MNKKTLIIILVLLLVLIIALLVYFFIFRPSLQKNNEEMTNKGILEKEGYSIKLPEGWKEAEGVSGASATIVNAKEEVIEPNAQKINFRSYYSVINDNLAENSPEDYFKKITESLKKSFPDIGAIKEEDKIVSENKIHFMEIEIRQQEIDFKVLLAVITKDKNVWTISFNTLKSNWEKYRELFYQIAGDFKIKTI